MFSMSEHQLQQDVLPTTVPPSEEEATAGEATAAKDEGEFPSGGIGPFPGMPVCRSMLTAHYEIREASKGDKITSANAKQAAKAAKEASSDRETEAEAKDEGVVQRAGAVLPTELADAAADPRVEELMTLTQSLEGPNRLEEEMEEGESQNWSDEKLHKMFNGTGWANCLSNEHIDRINTDRFDQFREERMAQQAALEPREGPRISIIGPEIGFRATANDQGPLEVACCPWAATTPVELHDAKLAPKFKEEEAKRATGGAPKVEKAHWRRFLLKEDKTKIDASVERILAKSRPQLKAHMMKVIGEQRRDHPDEDIIDQAARATYQYDLLCRPPHGPTIKSKSRTRSKSKSRSPRKRITTYKYTEIEDMDGQYLHGRPVGWSAAKAVTESSSVHP
jgi:hypothetical protein